MIFNLPGYCRLLPDPPVDALVRPPGPRPADAQRSHAVRRRLDHDTAGRAASGTDAVAEAGRVRRAGHRVGPHTGSLSQSREPRPRPLLSDRPIRYQ